MREAPSIDIINALRDKGAHIKAHDPIAMNSAKSVLGNDKIEYINNCKYKHPTDKKSDN